MGLSVRETEVLDSTVNSAHNVDHFLCYKVKIPKELPDFPEDIPVYVVDQFGQPKFFDIEKLSQLCNPVDKGGEGIKNPENHLMCYKIRQAEGEPKHERMEIYS